MRWRSGREVHNVLHDLVVLEAQRAHVPAVDHFPPDGAILEQFAALGAAARKQEVLFLVDREGVLEQLRLLTNLETQVDMRS